MSSIKKIGFHWTEICEILHTRIFRKSFEKIKFRSKYDMKIFMITPHWILLGMKNISEKVVEKIKTRIDFIFNIFFF